MTQVRFLKGKNEQILQNVPLTPGAIFFTEETQHLYIDTETKRLPVKSDYLSGQVFWVKLLFSNWKDNNTQSVDSYQTTKEDLLVPAPQLNTILTEDSIIFVGKSTYGNPDDTGLTPIIVAESSTENEITFRCIDIDGDGAIILPDKDVWIQLYCPNPKVIDMVQINATVLTTRIQLKSNFWQRKDGQYSTIIKIPNVDFSTFPFFVNLSDASLENKQEYQLMKMETTPDGEIKFTSNSIIDFNIEVDICIFLAAGIAGNKQVNNFNSINVTTGEWASFTVSAPPVSSSNRIEITAGALSDIEPGKERELLVFCTENNNADFTKIDSVEYRTNKDNPTQPVGVYTFNLKSGEEINSIFNCVVIQLNNIANIKEGILKSNKETPEGYENPWTKMTTKMIYDGTASEEILDTFLREADREYYYQYWPLGTEDSELLQGKYMPLVMPKNKEDVVRFSKICETKLYGNRIQFIIRGEDLPEFVNKDLEIRVIDFI